MSTGLPQKLKICNAKPNCRKSFSPLFPLILKVWSHHFHFTIQMLIKAQFSSVAQSCPTLCDPMNHSTPGLPIHHKLPEFTQTHVHPAISSSVVPFSSCPQSLPASGSFPMSQLFARGGQSIGVSASAPVLPVNTQDWSSLEWTGWISLQSKGLSRGMFQENSIETCILSRVKQITSPGWMHETSARTWCSGKT